MLIQYAGVSEGPPAPIRPGVRLEAAARSLHLAAALAVTNYRTKRNGSMRPDLAADLDKRLDRYVKACPSKALPAAVPGRHWVCIYPDAEWGPSMGGPRDA